MRCVARGLIAALLTVCLFLYAALRPGAGISQTEYDDVEVDEAARLLEGSETLSSSTSKPQTSLSAIIVVITCLIIISVLIAGIIVVAMTMDPSTGEESLTDDEESILYPESNSSPSKPTFQGLRGYDSMFDDEISCREL